MKRLIVGALALVTATAPLAVTAASAQSPREARQDRREAMQDLRRADSPREAREARQDLREANRDLDRAQDRRADRREMRRWRQGQRLDRRYGGYATVGDWRSRRLREPPRGYRWYRQGNDYVLAAVAGGLIASVIAASN